MTYVYRSAEIDPLARGRTFGARHAAQIAQTVSGYEALFAGVNGGPVDLMADGAEALQAIAAFAPHLHAEILGMAEGAGLAPERLGAINARTEVLARLGAQLRGECSAVIVLPPGDGAPVAVQTWDWYHRFAANWLVWEIPLADGSVTRTMTEFGIVGKAGMNSRGLGLLFTILHHQDDGGRVGVPVHVAARAALDLGRDINHAAQILGTAEVSASSSINLVSHEAGAAAALTVELFPGGPGFALPEPSGLLVHTNHFLAPVPARGDTEPRAFPDTLVRRDLLLRRLQGARTAEAVLAAMTSHLGTTAAVCCHHNPALPAADQYETLATVVIDLAGDTLTVHAGGPCGL